MQPRRLLIPAAIVAFIAIGAWIQLLLTSATPEIPLDEQHPDYIVTSARITEMSETGTPERILEASILRHYSTRDLSEAENPVLELRPADSTHWHVEADSAQVTRHGDEILLEGGVQIDTLEDPARDPMHIRTRDLRVLQKEAYAETAQPTVIESTHHRIEGIGMQAWLEEPVRVKLLTQVRGRHEID